MLGQKTVKSYPKLKAAMENDIVGRFPTIAKHINAIKQPCISPNKKPTITPKAATKEL